MCEFCEKQKEITMENNTGMVSHWFIFGTGKIFRLYCRMGNASNAYGIKIKYCPQCGRKLSEVKENE